jgi:hypothetical protein
MASFDAFSARLGLSQGRIEEETEDHVFVLGDIEPGYFHDLEPGDRAEVVQETDLTDIHLVRTGLKMSVPENLPSSLTWEVSIIVDGTKRARATCPSGRAREITDLAANVSKMSGVHSVGVRLQLVAP